MFLPGALGDINPKLNHRPVAESKRALRSIGRQYAKAVERGVKVASPIVIPNIRSIRRGVRFGRVDWSREAIEARIHKLESMFARPGLTDEPHVGGKPPLMTRGMEFARLQGLRSVLPSFRGARAPNPTVTLHGLKLGPVAFLGAGLELYHSLQAPLLRNTPHEVTWLVSLVGGMGYAPDQAARKKAGYAADFIPLICGEIPFSEVDVDLSRALRRLAHDLSA